MDSSTASEQAPDTFRAVLETSQGDVTIEVDRDWAPLGADRFYTLVKNGFYDGARFFRVLPGFVVQFGIAGDPALSERWRQARIADDPVKQSNVRGSVSFATAGPGTRTTQVFINLADNSNLDRMGFAPIGRVVEGMEAVERLYSGYGEGAPHGHGPDQGRIQSEGAAYLEKQFAKLDFIRQAAALPGVSGS